MAIDWGQASQVGGVGFGTVFLVLTILAVATLLISVAVRKISHRKNNANGNDKGD
jgi:Na+-transporting methylmalonyl-CoA/oxaloacetate decarboxylase gamma subunit